MKTLKSLTVEEIKRILKKYPRAREIAVGNFLGTLEGLSIADAFGNLSLDARLYKWDNATVNAIRYGINEAARKMMEEKE